MIFDLMKADDVIHKQKIDANNYWVKPQNLSYFDSINYDVDSINILGNCDLSWIAPPVAFECRLNIEYARFVDDFKVNLNKFQ